MNEQIKSDDNPLLYYILISFTRLLTLHDICADEATTYHRGRSLELGEAKNGSGSVMENVEKGFEVRTANQPDYSSLGRRGRKTYPTVSFSVLKRQYR